VVFVAGGGATLWVIFSGALSPEDDTIEWSISDLPSIPDSALPGNEPELIEEEKPELNEAAIEPTNETISATETANSATTGTNTEVVETLEDTTASNVVEEVIPEVIEKSFTLPESGTLAFEANGNPLGTSEYEYARLPDGRIQLFSQGEFSFKITFVEVSVKYRQQVVWGEDLEPVYYTAEFKGPLDFGNQKNTLTINGDTATLNSGKEDASVELPQGPLSILGMFSSYGFLVQLLAEDRLEFPLNTVFMGGGRPQEGQGGAQLQTFLMNIEQVEPMNIRVGNTEQQVERYAIQPADQSEAEEEDSGGNFQLLVQEGRWVGLLGVSSNGEEEGMFKVYRSDIFPEGFEIITDLRPDPTE